MPCDTADPSDFDDSEIDAANADDEMFEATMEEDMEVDEVVEDPSSVQEDLMAIKDVPPEKTWQNFIPEIFGAIMVAAYIIIIWMGSQQNKRIASFWGFCFKDVLVSQFAKVGDGAGGILSCISWNEYDLYCTGRQHCWSLVGRLNLRKRQDLLTYIPLLGNPNAPDALTLTVNMDVANMKPMFISICQEKLKKSVLDAYAEQDIKLVPVGIPALQAAPRPLLVLSDCADIARAILTDDITQELVKAGDWLQGLEIRQTLDVIPEAEHPAVIKLTCQFPGAGTLPEITEANEPCMKALFRLVDRCATFRPVLAVTQKQERQRDSWRQKKKQEERQRAEEALRNKKMEEEKKRREGLSREERMKLDAKQREKEMKRKQRKMGGVKIMR